MKAPFFVLSLDGGGARGLLSARVLANIESYLDTTTSTSVPLGQRFDLIAGTSTGGIIALGLALGRRASEVLALYERFVPLVFGKPKGLLGWSRRPKYDRGELKTILEEFFSDASLADVKTDICITSISLQNAKPRLHKSDYLARNTARLTEKVVDIALATSAAPTYFSAYSTKYSTNVIDGGLCANNPSVVSIVEAKQFERSSKRRGSFTEGWIAPELEDLVLISTGTGEPCAMPFRHTSLMNGGLMQWMVSIGSSGPSVPIVEIAHESQSTLAHFQALFLLEEGNYLRINPKLKFTMKLDQVSQAMELQNLADVTKDIEIFLKKHFH